MISIHITMSLWLHFQKHHIYPISKYSLYMIAININMKYDINFSPVNFFSQIERKAVIRLLLDSKINEDFHNKQRL